MNFSFYKLCETVQWLFRKQLIRIPGFGLDHKFVPNYFSPNINGSDIWMSTTVYAIIFAYIYFHDFGLGAEISWGIKFIIFVMFSLYTVPLALNPNPYSF